jgi:hypothetical protein
VELGRPDVETEGRRIEGGGGRSRVAISDGAGEKMRGRGPGAAVDSVGGVTLSAQGRTEGL